MNQQLNNFNGNKNLTYILILSLILTTAKGLRFGSSVGAGEILALIISLLLTFQNKGRIKNRIDKYTIIFWFTIIFLLLTGMLVRLNFHNMPNIFPRTLIAYLFSFIISFGILNSDVMKKDIEQTNIIYIKLTSIIVIIFSVLIFLDVRHVFGVNLYWLNTHRFQGWSLDPNQVAIPFIITPFLLLNYYRKNAETSFNKVMVLLALVCTVYFGLRTDSDSLIAAWLLGTIFSLGINVKEKLFKKRQIRKRNILFIMPFLSIVFIFLMLKQDDIIFYIHSFLMKDGQLETRIRIWSSSLDIIKKSPFFGLGPDVGLDWGKSIMGESHNNILHLGMSSGILGILTLLSYYYLIFRNILKSKEKYLIGAFIALFIFGLTHYTLRHPIYWFMLLLIDGISTEYYSYPNIVDVSIKTNDF